MSRLLISKIRGRPGRDAAIEPGKPDSPDASGTFYSRIGITIPAGFGTWNRRDTGRG